MSDELIVILVGDDNAGATLAARIDVDGELVFGLRLAGTRTGGFCDGAVDFTTDLADAVVRGCVSGRRLRVALKCREDARSIPATGEAGEVLINSIHVA